MTTPRKPRMFDSAKKPKTSMPGTVKDEVDTKAQLLIENVLKARYIQPPPKGHQFNCLVDITTKWLGSKFYFISIYACPGPNAHRPTFETELARLEYVGSAQFILSFMRHTGKWVRLYTGMSVDKCMKSIQDDPWFQP